MRPEVFGHVSAQRHAVPALAASAAGLALAIAAALLYPDSAFVYLFGVSLFGGLYGWLVIFITHLFFRPQVGSAGRPRLPVRMIGYPFTSFLGAAAILPSWPPPGGWKACASP